MLNKKVHLPTFNQSKDLQVPRFSFGAEDGTAESLLIEKYQLKRITAIGGSGLRCFSYFKHDLEASLFLTDKNEQCWMWDLWYKTYTSLSYQDFLFFWGLPPYGEKKMGKRRKKIFHNLDLDLKMHDYLVKWFEQNNWECLTFDGRFEQGFKKLSSIIKITFGKKFDDIFKFLTVAEQREFYEQYFSQKKWLLVLGIYSQSNVVNKFISTRGNLSSFKQVNMFSVYKKGFDFLFKNTLVRENFFMHLCFFGRLYHHDGLLEFMKKDQFQKNNEIIKGSYSFRSKTITDIEENLEEISPIDMVSISDQSAFIAGLEIEAIFEKIRRFVSPQGFIVWRSIAREAPSHLSGFKDVTDNYLSFIEKDKVQLQRFQIFQLI